ncbi:M3 family oligoendopeptidase [Fredinandcohnia humi]
MNGNKYGAVWNLDTIFPGESTSTILKKHLKTMEKMIDDLETKVGKLSTPTKMKDSAEIARILETLSDIQVNLSEANSFIVCLLAQNPKDQQGLIIKGKLSVQSVRVDKTIHKLKAVLANTKTDLWERLLETEDVKEYSFILTEWRKDITEQLSNDVEDLLSNVMIDGYHAWGQLYNTLISRITLNVPLNGETSILSVGQAINLRSHPQKDVRKESHLALEAIWKEKEDLFAHILNHIVGFRLQMHKARGITNGIVPILKENRIQEETLDAMWSVVSKYKNPFVEYLNQKAKLLGDEKMQSYQFWAPITDTKQSMTYKEAVHFILEHFKQFGPELEGFARTAFENGWIEAEDRPKKGAVAFCAGFPRSGQSRVFMTYGGRITSVLTLAHELGHAFHNHAMKSVAPMNKKYPLVIAETASTFSELIILDAAIKKAETPSEKLFLVDEKLKRSVMNFMNIHSRFLFEKSLYKERKEGFVSSAKLNEIMQEAIHEGYKGSFDSVSIRSWAWTPHYYLTKTPYYNFPYTFGYLFSLTLYARAKEKGTEFEKDYINLLRDSGRMSMEELVQKHIKEDITLPTFWERGMRLAVKDTEKFKRLVAFEHV